MSYLRYSRRLLWFAALGLALAGCKAMTSAPEGAVPPTITTQPSNQAANIGQPATFTVVATGTPPLTYQWKKNGAAISGATSSTYTTPGTTTSDNASQFTVVVSNSAGSATSSAATLTVNAAAVAPSITTQPASQTVTAGQTATFTVAATGTAPLTYQWKKNGAAISGATSSTYTTPATTTSDNALQFTVVVSNSTGSATSSAAILTVTPATLVSIAVTPANPSITAGGTQQFTATGTFSDSSTQNLTNSVTWTSSSTATATISATGLASALKAGSTTISAASGSVTGSTTLTVVASSNIGVSVSPKRGGLPVSQTISMKATVTSDSLNQGVTWTSTGGSFSLTSTTSGAATTYTAPNTAGVYTLTATSVSDVTKSDSVAIGVTDLAGIYTYHNNLSRDGSNQSEYALTPSNVTSTTFGKLFSCTVDGAIYAQPLWVANLTINGVKRNVVFVATQHDSLYAFDADANASPCVPLWHANLIDSTHGGTAGETSVPSGSGGLVGSGSGDIAPEVGITGTPVIDLTTNTIYVVSKSVIASGPTFFQRLHALDLTTGNEKFGGPMPPIAASVSGTGDGSSAGSLAFDPRNENQRPGLALVNGIVYISWASHEDHDPYHGWIIGYDASTLAIVSVFNDSPNGSRSGIWMSGGAPAADSSNNLYVITGNGTYDGATKSDYGESFLKLGTSSGISVSDWFTPADESSLEGSDIDFGAGGAAILVDQPSASIPHLVIGGGKEGNLFLLNRDNMGRFNSTNQVVQTLNLGSPIFATPAFWQDRLYLAGVSEALKTFSFNTTTGTFNTLSASQSSSSYGFPGATPSISATGASNGIVWAIDSSQYCTQQSPGCGPAVLHAYDATNLAKELWNSSQGSGNTAGNAVKFTVPTVANGKVYIGTRGNNTGGTTSSAPGELDFYGLKPN
jgi:hypothetical protein